MGTAQGYCILFWGNPKSNTPQSSCCTATYSALISQTIPVKRIKHARRNSARKDELISDVFHWSPTHGHNSVGQPAYTWIHQLCTDTGCSLNDLHTERERERERVRPYLHREREIQGSPYCRDALRVMTTYWSFKSTQTTSHAGWKNPLNARARERKYWQKLLRTD